MRRPPRARRQRLGQLGVGAEQLAVGRHGGQQLAVVADVGDRPSWSSATRSASITVEARWATIRPVVVGRAPAGAPPRPASRCARRARRGCRRGPGSWAGRGRRGPARAAGAGRPRATAPARRSGCRAPTGRSWTKPAWAMSSACCDLGVGGVGAAEGEVLAGAHREQRRLLERGRDQRAQVAEVEVADVDAVDGDPAAGDVVEPRDQGGQRRSCRSRWRRPARRSRRDGCRG